MRSLCTAALLFAAAGAEAGMIYKQVDAAGRVTYSDRADPTSVPLPSSVPRFVAFVPRNSAAINAREAARRFGKAQLQRDEGSRPLPWELNKDGTPDTLNPRYSQRQERLRLLVEQARRRVDETQQVQVAGR
jgi:hypothetical protein